MVKFIGDPMPPQLGNVENGGQNGTKLAAKVQQMKLFFNRQANNIDHFIYKHPTASSLIATGVVGAAFVNLILSTTDIKVKEAVPVKPDKQKEQQAEAQFRYTKLFRSGSVIDAGDVVITIDSIKSSSEDSGLVFLTLKILPINEEKSFPLRIGDTFALRQSGSETPVLAITCESLPLIQSQNGEVLGNFVILTVSANPKDCSPPGDNVPNQREVPLNKNEIFKV